MGVIDTINRFKKDTGVDIFKAIEEEGILLGMGFITDELGLADQLQSDLTYLGKIEELTSIYVKRKIKKKFALTDKDVEDAILKSLQNSTIGLHQHRKDFRYSEWLLHNQDAKDICQKYDNVLNPLFFMMGGGETKILPRSIFADRSFSLQSVATKNGFDEKGMQRYRGEIPIAQPGMFYIMGATNVMRNTYHPIVWYLLGNHTLDAYISDEFRKKVSKHFKELENKQTKVLASKVIIK